MIIRPQPGKQEEFIKSNADIVLYGGSAGSGKTFAILMDVLRYINHDGFNAIYFRQSLKEIKMPGGLWSESYRLYSYFNANANISDLMWNFYNSNKKVVSTLTFKQIENDASVYSFQGSQICGMYFDELTHFTWHQFNYLMSRNRSACGVKPYIRATCNPEKDHWLRNFIDWYIDPTTGYAIPERSGVIRYFVNVNDEVIWGDTESELLHLLPQSAVEDGARPKSFTFISAKLSDNQILMKQDPNYLSTLVGLNKVEQEKLLRGNWNISHNDMGELISRQDFFRYDLQSLLKIPGFFKESYFIVDGASTIKTHSDYSVIMFVAKCRNDKYYIIDIVRERLEEPDLEQKIIDTWAYWKSIKTGANNVFNPKGINIEAKSSGISMLQRIKRRSIPVYELNPIKDKFLRLNDGLGYIKNQLVGLPFEASWVSKFIEECESFRANLKHVIMTNEKLPHDDQVDCLAYALGQECNNKVPLVVYNPNKNKPQLKKVNLWN